MNILQGILIAGFIGAFSGAIFRLLLEVRKRARSKMFFSKHKHFYVVPVPVVDESIPEDVFPRVYFVSTYSGCVVASFDNYDDAVDLIVLIENFCESRGLSRKEC